MKYIKARKNFIFILNPLLILMGVLLIWFYAKEIVFSFYAFWIATAAALLLFVLPLGSEKLAPPHSEVTRFPLWFFLLCTFIMELSLIGMYWGMSHIAGTWLTVNTAPHPDLFLASLSLNTEGFGLFPWTLYAVITAYMSLLAYRHETHAYFSNLLKPFLHQDPQESLGLIANVGMRRCVSFAFSIALLFFSLLIINLFFPTSEHVAHGFMPATLITTLILIFIPYTQIFKKIINRFFSRRISTFLSLPVFCLTLSAAILFLSATMAGLTQNSATISNVPGLITEIIQKNWVANWFIFSGLWWLCLTPAVCSFFSKIAVGYRIRAVIACILLLPVTICLLNLLPIQWFMLSDNMLIILSIISFVIGLPLLLNHKRSSNIINAYFPKRGVEKPRDQYPFFQRTAQMTLIAFYFYLVLGINGLNLYFFAFTYLIIIGLLLAVVAMFKNNRQA